MPTPTPAPKKNKKSIFEMVFGEQSQSDETMQAIDENREDYIPRMKRKGLSPKPPRSGQ